MGSQYEISLEAKELYLIVVGLLLLLVLFFFIGMIVGKRVEKSQAEVMVAAEVVAEPEEEAEEASLPLDISSSAEEASDTKDLSATGEEAEKEADEAAPGEKGEEKVEYTYYDSLVQGKGVGIQAQTEEEPAPEVKDEEKAPSDSGGVEVDSIAPEEMAQEGRFTIQIASFLEREQAQNLVRWLRERKYPAFMVTADIPGRGTWHRVRVGRFPSKAEAIQYQKKLENKIHLRGFIAQFE